MKSLILYGSPLKLTKYHIPVIMFPDYYVRTQVFQGDYPQALDKAKPMVGEIVLNTVPISDTTPTL